MATITLKKVPILPRVYYSELQRERVNFQPPVPHVFSHPPTSIAIVEKEALGAVSDHEHIQQQFPNTYGKPRVELSLNASGTSEAKPFRVGVVLSGGQAPGGHNVIAGELFAICLIVFFLSPVR
jgi:pyrophosphate--fructose-6-phosphate 1-phosphotransferase